MKRGVPRGCHAGQARTAECLHGARHDGYAFAASGLAEVLIDNATVADLGYVGVEGIDTVPYKRFPGIDLNTGQIQFNTSLSKIRAAVEHAIALPEAAGSAAIRVCDAHVQALPATS